MKKIAMVAAPVHRVPPRNGAAVEWWMYQVCRRLSGFEPHIISVAAEDYADEERRDGIAFHRIRIGQFYRRLFQKILGVDPCSYARRVARRLDSSIPISCTCTTPRPCSPGWPGITAVRRVSSCTCITKCRLNSSRPGTVLFTVSRYLKERYAARLPGADIRVVTNGVDTDVFRPLPPGISPPCARA